MKDENQEMGLFDLLAAGCRAIGRFFKWLFRLVGHSFQLATCRWYIVWAVVLVGLGGAFWWSRPSNRIYKVGTVVQLNGCQASDVQREWERLAFAAPAKIAESQTYQNLLGLTPEQTVGLQKFQYFSVIDCLNDSTADYIDFQRKHDPSDTVNVVMPNQLYLQFRTKRPQEAAQIGEKVLSYLNQRPNLQAQYEHYYQVLSREALFCQTQVELLDSFSTVFYFQQGTDSQLRSHPWANGFLIGDRRIDLLHPDILELLEQAKQTEYELSCATAPVVAKADFTVQPRPVNGRLKCLGWGLIIGYVLGCLLALLIDKRAKVGQYLKRQ